MAKTSYRTKLVETNAALETLKTERNDLASIFALASTDELKAKMSAISKRYDADFAYLSDKVNYMIGKVAVEDVEIRAMILRSLEK